MILGFLCGILGAICFITTSKFHRFAPEFILMASYENLEYEDMLFEADDHIRNNRISDAVSLLESIIAQAPDYGKAYNHLGWIFETKLKDYKRAENMYRQCLAFSPEYPPVYLNLSIALSTLGKYDELEVLLNQALTVAGVEKAAIYNEFGILYELRQDYNKAIENFREAVRFTLSDPNVETYMKSIDRCRKKRDLLSS
jgi:tetratricopeptide (TPR) repeat protein